MLDQQDGHSFALQRAQERGKLLLLGVAQSGRRLVEQEKPRIGREGPRNFDQALLPERERSRRGMQMRGEPDPTDLKRRFVHRARLLPPIEPQRGANEPGAAAQVRSECDVVEYRHLGKEPHVLESPGNTQTSDDIRVLSGNTLAIERDRPAGHWQRAADQVEHRALACAIGADQPEDLAAANLERKIVDRDEAAKLFSGSLDHEQRPGRRPGARQKRFRGGPK